jgi:hypothetical protein
MRGKTSRTAMLAACFTLAATGVAGAQEYGPEWDADAAQPGQEWQPQNADQDPNFQPRNADQDPNFQPDANQCGSGLLGTGVGCDPSGQGGGLDSGPLSGGGLLGGSLVGLFGGR